MEIIIYQCEYCGKRVDNYPENSGWMELNDNFGIVFIKKKERKYWSKGRDLHFCCIKCFNDFFKNLIQKI